MAQQKFQSYLWVPGVKRWEVLGEYDTPEPAIEQCREQLDRWHPEGDLFAVVLVQPSTKVWDSRTDK
jgi:hypothetical protein